MRLKVGVANPRALLISLRERLAPHVELVDLAALDAAQLAARVPELDILLHYPPIKLDRAFLERAAKLRAALLGGAGYDGIDLEAATEKGVIVSNMAGGNAEAVAEHAFGLLLALAKKISLGERYARTGQPWAARYYTNNEIRGKTLGIIGFGHIGRRIGEIARGGFAMRVLAYVPRTKEAAPGVEMVTLDRLLAESDVVSISVPLTAETRGMIGADEIAKMKPGAVLLNTARGHIVDQEALVAALKEGRLGGAGLDVVDDDRLDADHPLFGFDNVVISPHIAGITLESFVQKEGRQAEAVLAVCKGEIPQSVNVLNPKAAAAFRARFGGA